MDTVEISALEYVEYGVLTALACAASAVPFPPETNNDVLALNGCCMAYEVITAALEALPVHESGVEARAQLAAHIDQMRSFVLFALGGRRGDKTAMLDQLSARSDDLARTFAQLRQRLGIDPDLDVP